jgi:AraC-like DNA-binding protein
MFRYWDKLKFSMLVSDAEERVAPYSTPWRQLQSVLLEWADGGAWLLYRQHLPPTLVQQGDVLLVPAGQRHRLVMHEGARSMSTTWALLNYVLPTGLDALAQCRLPGILPGDIGRRVKSVLAKLAAVARDSLLRPVATGHKMAYELLVALADAAEMLPPVDLWEHQRLAPVLSYVHAHLDTHLDRNVLARLANLSPTRFHYVFKDAFGAPPMAYVQAERVRRAQELLLGSDLTANEVAGRCGFQTPQYLNRVFQNRTGYTPGAFRRAFGQSRRRVQWKGETRRDV